MEAQSRSQSARSRGSPESIPTSGQPSTQPPGCHCAHALDHERRNLYSARMRFAIVSPYREGIADVIEVRIVVDTHRVKRSPVPRSVKSNGFLVCELLDDAISILRIRHDLPACQDVFDNCCTRRRG